MLSAFFVLKSCKNILNKFPDAEIILHVDPSNVIEEKEFVDA